VKKVIYYFTGTGNSMRAAEKIALRLKDTEIISMRNAPEDVPAADADLIGFVYPVYQWTMPLPVERFVSGLSINPKAYVFVVTTPVFINGYACETLNELLAAKGAKLAYAAIVHSVANYVIVYPPFPFPARTVPRAEKKLNKVADDIAEMRTKDIPKAGAFVRKKYQTLSKYHKLMPMYDYGFTVNDRCISCGLCSKLCPCRNIVISDGKVSFNHQCTHCMACVVFCPKRAIGYQLPESMMEQLDGNLLDLTLIKNMGLPQKRKTYHNPYITAADIILGRKKFDN